jgi:hypothetical protein
VDATASTPGKEAGDGTVSIILVEAYSYALTIDKNEVRSILNIHIEGFTG